MLGSAATVEATAKIIAEPHTRFGVIVLDPVLVATSGDTLSDDDAALDMVNHLPKHSSTWPGKPMLLPSTGHERS